MDRRDFLKAAAALPAAAVVPEVVEARPILSASSIRAVINQMMDNAALASSGDYVAFLHPRVHRDLIDLAARDRWREAHRSWRKDGRPDMGPRQIIAKYA